MGLKIVKRNAIFRNDTPGTAGKQHRKRKNGPSERIYGRDHSNLNKFVCIALDFCDIRLRRKYGSRLGNTSPTACITCSASCIRESKASRLLRTKHANANEFALLSASAYICMI